MRALIKTVQQSMLQADGLTIQTREMANNIYLDAGRYVIDSDISN
jgi:hypothetical protein